MNITDEGLQLIKAHEGCRLKSYPDPGSGGDPWTIGYGHTGPEVVPGLTITQEQADEYLRSDVARFEQCVLRAVQIELTDGQFDALVSFAFNAGCKAMAGSTLVRKLNAGDAAGAADEFGKWTKASGRVLPGLVTRRGHERERFLA